VVGPPEPQRPTAQQLKDQPGLAALHGLEPALPPTQHSGPPAQQDPPKEPKAQLSLDKLKDALDANPFILDTMIATEFERGEGPRKEALRLFLKEENKKGEPNRRVDVLEQLANALKPPAPAKA